MSLVHESLIAALNRKFVSCHFNANPRGPGGDAAASAFINKHGFNPRYGCVVTTDGKMLVSFGFGLREVFQAFQDVIEPNAEEDAILEGKDFLAAAQLAGDLLLFEEAHALAAKAVASGKDKARALYLQAHLKILDVVNSDPAGARRILTGLSDPAGGLPADLGDDVALDLVWLDIELTRRRGGFYNGWRFRKGTAKAALPRLRKAIEQWPQSNRIGQMHFFLGLALRATGEHAEADEAWTTHFTRWPEDRWAMPSRIHHSSYRFSPYKNTHGGVVLDTRGKGKLAQKLRKLMEKGGGAVTDPELVRELLKRMRKQNEAPKGDGEDADDKESGSSEGTDKEEAEPKDEKDETKSDDGGD